MTFLEMAAARESCRDYLTKPVEPEKLEQCLRAARLAPSACNSQPWHFTVVTGEKARQTAKLTQGMGMNKFTDNVPAFIVITEEKASLTARVGGAVKSQEYAQMDIGLAAAHLCFAALDQGLSTCILGWFDEKGLRELLGIPQGKRIRLVVCVGYSAGKPLREKKRKALEEIASFAE